MNKFRVRFYLDNAFCLSPFATLDSILAYQAVLERGRFEEQDKLPLVKVVFGDSFYYKASSWFADKGTVISRKLTRSYPAETAMRLLPASELKNINRSSDIDRQYVLSFQCISSPFVDFLGEGDLEEVKKLAAGLTHLGKKSTVGFGKIRGVECEATGKDPVLAGSIPLRPLPVSTIKLDWQGKAPVGYRPPYWGEKELCYVPPVSPGKRWEVIQREP